MKYAVIMLALAAAPVLGQVTYAPIDPIITHRGMLADQVVRDEMLRREMRLERERKGWEVHDLRLEAQRAGTEAYIEYLNLQAERRRQERERLLDR